MALKILSLTEDQKVEYLGRLHQDDERILTIIYNDTFRSLRYFGMKFLNDEFAVTNIIHECFLKAWDYRHKMESVQHVYFFIRMNMKWQFRNQYRNANYRFYRSVFLMECLELFFEDNGNFSIEDNRQQQEEDEKRIQAVYRVIPYLPATHKNITLLHFKYGLSYAVIAKRYGLSNQKVMNELQQSIKKIKQMTLLDHIKKQALNDKPEDAPSNNSQKIKGTPEEILDMRTQQNMSFDEIAQIIGKSREITLKLFVEAKNIQN